MTTLILAIALLGQVRFGDMAKTPEPPAPLATAGAVEAPAPPEHAPLIAPSCPCNQAATEGAIRDLRNDLGRLRAELAIARANPPQVQAPAAPPKASPPKGATLYELYDSTGVRCTGRDPDELSRRVQQRDLYFAQKEWAKQLVITPVYATAPTGVYGGAFSAPMSFGSFGGGFMGGGGRAGGSCR